MQQNLIWLVFVSYFTFFNTCETNHANIKYGIPYIFSRLFEIRDAPPTISYLEPSQYTGTIEKHLEDDEEILYDKNYEDDSDGNNLTITQIDERPHKVYYWLKTTSNQEEIELVSQKQQPPEKFLNFLRQTFIGRSQQLRSDGSNCPERRATLTGCKIRCQKFFEDHDKCELKEIRCGFECHGRSQSKDSQSW